ncbi:MAG TPA: DUF4184 family protein [Nevskia sp.]|nr:DUF4184 family protein [Nevskia sp.]
MPFTLAHPAAVLPLRGRPRLDFAALVTGSLTPDFGYYLLMPGMRFETHSFAGGIEICLPVGLALLLLFHALKRPLCEALPQPHRGALLPLVSQPVSLKPLALLTAAASVLLGVWTHLLWDAFTHRGSWGPQHLPLLRSELFTVAGKVYWLSDLLQWLSSAAGLLVLVLGYRRWLRQQPLHIGDGGEKQRRLWLVGLTVLAMVLALPFTQHRTQYFSGLRAYAFQEWVHAAAFFSLTLVIYALLRRRIAGGNKDP